MAVGGLLRSYTLLPGALGLDGVVLEPAQVYDRALRSTSWEVRSVSVLVGEHLDGVRLVRDLRKRLVDEDVECVGLVIVLVDRDTER